MKGWQAYPGDEDAHGAAGDHAGAEHDAQVDRERRHAVLRAAHAHEAVGRLARVGGLAHDGREVGDEEERRVRVDEREDEVLRNHTIEIKKSIHTYI